MSLQSLAKSAYCRYMIVCKLREVLNRMGWTRYRLHKESGITYPTLHAMYHNRSKLFSAVVLNKLCLALKCKPGDLLKYETKRLKAKVRRVRRG